MNSIEKLETILGHFEEPAQHRIISIRRAGGVQRRFRR